MPLALDAKAARRAHSSDAQPAAERQARRDRQALNSNRLIVRGRDVARDPRESIARQSFARADEQSSIDRLWNEYRHRRSAGRRESLITHYMSGHVRRLAERLRSRLPRQVDVDDLVQQAYTGLVKAIDRFDVSRHVRFETFSSPYILGAMRDYLREIDPIPRLTRTVSKKVLEVEDSFYKSNGRQPDLQELRSALRLTEEKFQRVLTKRHPASTVSYNSRPGSNHLPGHVLDAFPDDSDGMASFEGPGHSSPLDRAQHSDLRRWLTAGFSRRDRLIIILYYYESLTMKETGRTLGISESRVSQRLESIIACLRSRLRRVDAEEEFLDK